jgi:hypothetical protein
MEITITHAELAAWQRRATNLLARLLTTFPALPVITWTVGHAGSTLAGRCDAAAPDTRRAHFAAWCAALGAIPCPDHTSGGVTYLRAVIGDLDGVHVHLMADIFVSHVEEANHGTR